MSECSDFDGGWTWAKTTFGKGLDAEIEWGTGAGVTACACGEEAG